MAAPSCERHGDRMVRMALYPRVNLQHVAARKTSRFEQPEIIEAEALLAAVGAFRAHKGRSGKRADPEIIFYGQQRFHVWCQQWCIACHIWFRILRCKDRLHQDHSSSWPDKALLGERPQGAIKGDQRRQRSRGHRRFCCGVTVVSLCLTGRLGAQQMHAHNQPPQTEAIRFAKEVWIMQEG